MNSLHQDLFSPIRLGSSDADSSDDSESLNCISNSEFRFSLSKTLQKKHVSEYKEVQLSKETNELKSDEQNSVTRNSESIISSTPVSDRNSSKQLNSKKFSSDFNKLKLDKEKNFKDINVFNKESSSKNSESQRQSQRKNVSDRNVSKSHSEQNELKKRHSSRPTSLLPSKDELPKCSVVKDVKKKEKTIDQSSKNIYKQNGVHKPDAKQPPEKKLIDSSLDLKKKSNVPKYKDSSVKSTNLNDNKAPMYDSLSRKPNAVNEQVESSKAASNPLVPCQYEASIEKMVHDHISVECDKMRQNICTQQMSFYRELNKLKGEMEQQHSATTERMVKFIEDLMQVNMSLKSISSHNKN